MMKGQRNDDVDRNALLSGYHVYSPLQYSLLFIYFVGTKRRATLIIIFHLQSPVSHRRSSTEVWEVRVPSLYGSRVLIESLQGWWLCQCCCAGGQRGAGLVVDTEYSGGWRVKRNASKGR